MHLLSTKVIFCINMGKVFPYARTSLLATLSNGGKYFCKIIILTCSNKYFFFHSPRNAPCDLFFNIQILAVYPTVF